MAGAASDSTSCRWSSRPEDPRQLQIEDHTAGPIASRLEEGLGVRVRLDREPACAQEPAQGGPRGIVVVDDEHGGGWRRQYRSCAPFWLPPPRLDCRVVPRFGLPVRARFITEVIGNGLRRQRSRRQIAGRRACEGESEKKDLKSRLNCDVLA